MSASDAAPLPRLGEVFFDVRGNSRSMRLSWYADTDVAVFSIWQGGKCTGTFRLPMDDLGRMIEILQRGPEGRSRRATAERRPAGRAAADRGPAERGPLERGPVDRGPVDRGYQVGYTGENTVVHNPGPHMSPASAGDYQSASAGDYQYGTGDYAASDYGSEYPAADHRGPSDYNAAERRPSAEYADYGEPRASHHRTERYEPADYGRPDYGQGAEWWQEEDPYQADRTGQRFVPPDEAGYGEQRFAPPYVHPGPDSSDPGFMDDPDYGLPADPAGRSRHSAGRHSGGQAPNRS